MSGPTATHFSPIEGLILDLYSFAPVAAVLDFAYSGLSWLSAALSPIAGTAATALAIVALTLIVRTALIPAGVAQMRAELTRARLAPKLRELQKRFKKKPEVLQHKMLELYRDEKTSPFAGMLPALLQAPVLSIVYGLFILGTINGHPNTLLSDTLGSVPLGDSLIVLIRGGDVWPGVLVYVALLSIIAIVATATRLLSRRYNPPQPDATPEMQRVASWLSWLPFITVVFAAITPLAATIYLTVTTTWTLAERTLLRHVVTRSTPRQS